MMERPWTNEEEDLLIRSYEYENAKKKPSFWSRVCRTYQEGASMPENGIEEVDGESREINEIILREKYKEMTETGSAEDKQRKKSAKDDVPSDIDEGAKKRKRKTSSQSNVSDLDADEGGKRRKRITSSQTNVSDVDADESAKKKKRKTFSYDSVSKVGVNKEMGESLKSFGVGVDAGTENKRAKKERAEEKKQRKEGKPGKEREKSRKR